MASDSLPTYDDVMKEDSPPTYEEAQEEERLEGFQEEIPVPSAPPKEISGYEFTPGRSLTPDEESPVNEESSREPLLFEDDSTDAWMKGYSYIEWLVFQRNTIKSITSKLKNRRNNPSPEEGAAYETINRNSHLEILKWLRYKAIHGEF